MPSLTINGHSVTVDDSFDKLSPDEQNATVDHIAKQLHEGAPASGVGAHLSQGISDLASGVNSTLGLGGAKSDTLDSIAKNAAPKDFKAAKVIGDDWSFHPGNIPNAIAAQAPGLAADLLAAKTGATVGSVGGIRGKVLGGIVGGLGSMALRTFGPGAHENAKARTGDENAPVTGEDMAREGVKQAIQAPLNAVGINRLLPGGAGKVAGVGLEGAGSALKKYLGTAAIETATGAGRDAINQGVTNAGQEHAEPFDWKRPVEAGITSGVTGATVAAPRLAGDTASAVKFRKFGGDNAEAATAHANRIIEHADGKGLVGPLGGTATAAEAVGRAHADIHKELTAASQGLDLSTENANTLNRAKNGGSVSNKELNALSTEAPEEVVHLARQAQLSRQLKDMGEFKDGKFTGGISGVMEQKLRAIYNPAAAATSMGAVALGLPAMIGLSPHLVGGVYGAYAGARMLDKLTGSRSPAKGYTDKFGDPSVPTRLPGAPEAPPAEPLSTSVPQVAPPSATAQPWGSPKPEVPGIDASAQNADIQGMLRMAMARRNVAAQQAPAEAPGLDARALNEQVKSALLMAAARRDIAGKQQAEGIAADSPTINDQGGIGTLSNPAFAKRGAELLRSANVMQRLTAQPEPAAADVPAPAPAPPPISPTALTMLKQKLKQGLPPAPPEPAPAPVAPPAPPIAQPAAPIAQAEPAPDPTSIASVLSRVTAQIEASKAQNPAATPPGGVTPPVAPEPAPPVALPKPVVSQLTKLKGKVKERTGPSEYMDPDTGEMLSHTPLTKDELWGRNLSHEEFARRDTDNKIAELAKEGKVLDLPREHYETGIISDRRSREQELQLASQHEAGPDDVPLAKLLLQELHHQRYGLDAKSAAKFYGSHMSPPMRAAVAKLMDGPFKDMWSKDSKDVPAVKVGPKMLYKFRKHALNHKHSDTAANSLGD